MLQYTTTISALGRFVNAVFYTEMCIRDRYLTDQSGQAFREQVLAYMEQRYGMDLVKKFTGTTEKWEQTETEESDMEKKTDEMTDAMERVNDSLDASGSQTDGEDVEEGPSLPDEELSLIHI